MQLLLLTLVCSTPACVFVRSTVCAFWGSALSKGHLVVKLHCVGLQPFGEREGLLAALGSCKSGCPSCFADPSERGVSPRLEVGGVSLLCARFDRVLCVALRLQLFLRMRLRLLYLCLRAWPPCCRSVVGVVVFLDVSGSGRAREVRQRFAGQQVTGHQVESFMSACVDARLFHYVPMLLFDLL